MRIVHGSTAKFRTMLCRPFPALREGSVVTLPEVETMIHVAVKMIPSVVPGSGPDE